MFKIIFLTTLAIFVSLLAVMFIRAIKLHPLPTEDVSAIKVPSVDAQKASNNLSQAVQFKTIATLDGNKENEESFIGFHKFLRETYSDVFSKLEVKEFKPFGLLLKWQGKNSELKPIMLMAHQDVLPADERSLNNWTHPPFSGAIDKGMIYGRGTVSDKNVLIGILESTSALIKEGFEPERTIYILFGDNKEVGGSTAAAVANYFKENNIKLDSVIDKSAGIFIDGYKQLPPIARIGVAEKGKLDVELSTTSEEWNKIVPPNETVSGIIGNAVARLEANQLPIHFEGFQRTLTDDLSRHMPFYDRFWMANLWVSGSTIKREFAARPPVGVVYRTTTAVTSINSEKSKNGLFLEAKAHVHFRIIPGETVESVMEHVKKSIDDPRIKIVKGENFNPTPVSSFDNKPYRAIARSIKAVFPEKEPIVGPGVALEHNDSRYFTDISENLYRFSCVLITRADAESIYGVNEKISVENVGRMIQFNIILIKELT